MAEKKQQQWSFLGLVFGKTLSMRVLNFYILNSVLLTFIMALVVLTFMMVMGSLLQVFELVLKKFDVLTILEFIGIVMAQVLCYALPFSVAGASLLVYSRFSADGEITAMKATGVSIFRIAFPTIALATVIAILSFYAHNNVLPLAQQKQRELVANYDVEDPMALIETGTFKAIGPYRIKIGEKHDEELKDIELIEDLSTHYRNIKAKEGRLHYQRAQAKLQLELSQVTTEERDTRRTNSFLMSQAGRVIIHFYLDPKKRQIKEETAQMIRKDPKGLVTEDIKEMIADRENLMLRNACRREPGFKQLSDEEKDKYVKALPKEKKEALIARAKKDIREGNVLWGKLKGKKPFKQMLSKVGVKKMNDAWVAAVNEKSYEEMIAALKEIDGNEGETTKLFEEWHETWLQSFHNNMDYRSRYLTEINKRAAYAFASIAFALLGIPLGIRAHRSEKTIGFLICLGLIALHYSLIILVETFKENYALYPYLCIWFPDILFVVAGLFFMWRNHKYS